MPSSLARALLLRKVIIRPGLETNNPKVAVERYQQQLSNAGVQLSGSRVLVLGYGGSFAVGCGLLRAGARHIVLCDPYAPPDDQRNRALLPEYGEYLQNRGNQVMPRAECITLLEEDIRQTAARGQFEPVDLVISSSVFEHLDDVEGITAALAALTCPDGWSLHFVDLRDHFFRYPFQMLMFSDRVWRGWLNPGTNLNRKRMWDYRRIFESYYQQVDLAILESDASSLVKARPYLRAEFLSGDPLEDSATIIRVLAKSPRRA